jgi:hypothetical protein
MFVGPPLAGFVMERLGGKFQGAKRRKTTKRSSETFERLTGVKLYDTQDLKSDGFICFTI